MTTHPATQRDQLAATIANEGADVTRWDADVTYFDAADVLLADGWRKVQDSPETIERMARALYKSTGLPKPWERLDAGTRRYYESLARAALASLLEDPQP